MRSEEHTSELQSLPTISYAVFCLKKKKKKKNYIHYQQLLKTTKTKKTNNNILFLFNLSLRFLNVFYFFFFFFFFFNDTATTEIYTVGNTLSLHDALPIYPLRGNDIRAAED